MTKTDTNTRDEFAQLEDDWESASRYLSIFIDESQQTIDELTEALLASEASGGRKGIEQLFIGAHRIKGSAASIGLNRPARLAHLMEDLLQVLVDEDRALAPNIADGLLACTDGLRQYVNQMKAGQPGEDHFDVLAQQLLDAQYACGVAIPSSAKDAGPASPAAGSEQDEALSEATGAASEAVNQEVHVGISADVQQRVAAAIRDDEHEPVLVGQIIFEPNIPLVGLKARLVYSKLANLGNIRYLDPPLEEVENLDEIAAIYFGIATERGPEEVRQLAQVAGIKQMTIEPLAAKRLAAKAPARGRATSSEAGTKPAETLRVDIERLDRLMNLAGQLAIGKARVAQIGDKLKKAVDGGMSLRILERVDEELKKMAGTADGVGSHAELEEFRSTARRLQSHLETVHREVESFVQARGSVNDLFETIHLLDSVSDGIRQNVMDMRMLPVGPLFTRFHRVIRDITRANGKDIQLLISGEKTELDKRMIDELGDPMIHLIRNAADHGIESPETRQAAGKPAQGTITLDAFHRGSNIVIRVSDDGKGLDTDRLRAKAVEKNLVSPADAEVMTRQQICQLIWLPGLSTADKVTDVSGRGVGMDIVRSKIHELSGTVDVESEPGRGTVFTIKLPLTLAVLPSLMVEIDGDVFAVPLESVMEIVHVDRNEMATVHGHWTASVRDRVVAVLRLGAVLKWHHGGHNADTGELEQITMVIIGEENQHVGLAVDRVLGEEDVVIKSIADNYRNIGGIAGASILGDGRISLILDPPTLIEMLSHPVVATAET